MMMMVRLFHCNLAERNPFSVYRVSVVHVLYIVLDRIILWKLRVFFFFIWLTSPNVKPQKRTENVCIPNRIYTRKCWTKTKVKWTLTKPNEQNYVWVQVSCSERNKHFVNISIHHSYTGWVNKIIFFCKDYFRCVSLTCV